MNNKIYIPKGWRELNQGEIIADGDMLMNGQYDKDSPSYSDIRNWKKANTSIGDTYDSSIRHYYLRIRKVMESKKSYIPQGWRVLWPGSNAWETYPNNNPRWGFTKEKFIAITNRPKSNRPAAFKYKINQNVTVAGYKGIIIGRIRDGKTKIYVIKFDAGQKDIFMDFHRQMFTYVEEVIDRA